MENRSGTNAKERYDKKRPCDIREGVDGSEEEGRRDGEDIREIRR